MCKKTYGLRMPPEDPPCNDCRVDLTPENEDAAAIYQICKRQVLTAGPENEVIDLDYSTVIMVMDLYQVKDKKGCLNKVSKIFHHMLNDSRSERD